MVDNRSIQSRSALMSRVSSRNTGPEMVVRRLLHAAGYRFRLHRRGLPGTPDIVFGSRRKIIFVHGCFWHGHDCQLGRLPRSRVTFWAEKQRRNRQRDLANVTALESCGWTVMVVWQCELKIRQELLNRLLTFLGGSPSKNLINEMRIDR